MKYALEWIMLAVALGMIPASVARAKGHDFLAWWAYGAVLFVAALPNIVMIGVNRDVLDQRKAREGFGRCPYCAEMVRQQATKCRYCQSSLVS